MSNKLIKMLAYDSNNGIALIPNPPKERYSCPVTGAHFEFRDVCMRIEKVMKQRAEELKKNGGMKMNKDFMSGG